MKKSQAKKKTEISRETIRKRAGILTLLLLGFFAGFLVLFRLAVDSLTLSMVMLGMITLIIVSSKLVIEGMLRFKETPFGILFFLLQFLGSPILMFVGALMIRRFLPELAMWLWWWIPLCVLIHDLYSRWMPFFQSRLPVEEAHPKDYGKPERKQVLIYTGLAYLVALIPLLLG